MQRLVLKVVAVFAIIALVYMFINIRPLTGGASKDKASNLAINQSVDDADLKVENDAEPSQNSADSDQSLDVEGEDSATKKHELPALTASEVLSIRDDDIVFGDPNSKVLLFDYSSITCFHCAEYLEAIFPEIKGEFIDTGKIAYIKRLIPSNGPALKASQILRCIDDKSKRYGMIETLMKYQNNWIKGKFTEYMDLLKEYAEIAGVSSEEFERCVSDDEAGLAIYNHLVRDAKAINLLHSPSLYVNGKIYEGSYEYDDLKAFIESHIK